jgi:hypothetical protein
MSVLALTRYEREMTRSHMVQLHVGVHVVTHVVDVEAADVRKEIVVGEEFERRDAVVAPNLSPITRSPLTCTRSREAGFRRPTVPSFCMPEEGMGKT